MRTMRILTLFGGLFAASSGLASAIDISGVISSTLTITDDSRFVGDVTCQVMDAPCISFGAPGITLNLNGFSMRGLGARDSCPSYVYSESAINTNGQDNVAITGPGLVTSFKGDGILLIGNNAQVTQLVISGSCVNGLELQGSGHTVLNSTVVRASLAGIYFDGIAVLGGGGHIVQNNDVIGASSLIMPGGHGIFISSNGNLLQSNNASGNPGAGLFIGDGASSNVIVGNKAFGNILYHDIFDNNPAGANTYQSNTCEVSGGAGAPVCPAVQ
jgi:parallel beta-helix repeat protein